MIKIIPSGGGFWYPTMEWWSANGGRQSRKEGLE